MNHNFILFLEMACEYMRSLCQEWDRKRCPNLVVKFALNIIHFTFLSASLLCFVSSLFYLLSLDKGTFQLGALYFGYFIDVCIAHFLFKLAVLKFVMVEKDPKSQA